MSVPCDGGASFSCHDVSAGDGLPVFNSSSAAAGMGPGGTVRAVLSGDAGGMSLNESGSDAGVGLPVFNQVSGSEECTGPGVVQASSGHINSLNELRDIMTRGVDLGNMSYFHGLLCQGIPDSHTLVQLGVSVLQLFFCSPRDGRLFAGLCTLEQNIAAPLGRDRELLPLPVPPLGAALKLCRLFTPSPTGLLVWDPKQVKSRGKQQTKKLIAAGCFQIWRLLSVIVLNGEFQGWMPPLFPHRSFPGLASQQQAFKHIDGVCSYFVREPQSSHSGLAPQELVRTKGVDYTGEEVLHALPLKLEELLPSLPADGVAGSLQACEVAEGEIAEWLLNPERALLPRDQWPKPIPKATMNCSRDEWDRLVPVLVGKGILQPIRKHEILHVEGIPLLNGAFAVPKKGLPGPGQQRVTRLIMNMIPGNSIQRLMPGDLGTLASASQWVSAHLKPGQVLLWSGDDQRGAFYAWALPTAWRQYMAFRWPVAGHLVGMPHEVEVYVAAAVIPMGWINAVGLFQHLHRRLGLAAEPVGAEHPAELEWRRDRPVPRSAVTESGGWIQYYLDDFDCPEFVDESVWRRLCGTISSLHSKQRAAYSGRRVEISAEKAHVREPRVIRMGAEVDGIRGFVGPPREKLLETGWLGIWLLSRQTCGVKPLLMLLGRLVRCYEFRRPLMSILDTCWPKERWRFRRTLKVGTVSELVRAIGALALAIGSLRTPYSGLVTCSDASLHGGGLCASAGLTQEGDEVLAQMESGKPCFFKPAGALFERGTGGPRILVVSLLDGIGALMVALTRLPCQVVAYASSEVDKACRRVARRRWPGMIELGEVSSIELKALELLRRSIGQDVDCVLVGARSYCQTRSASDKSHDKLDGGRPRLLHEVSRIIGLLKSCFSVPVHFLVETDSHVNSSHTQLINTELGCEPLLIDSKWFSWCRGTRLFWCSWTPGASEVERIIQHGNHTEWLFPCCRGEASDWLEAGATWNGKPNEWLPPLSQRKARRTPPSSPVGIENASPEAIARWRTDQYRMEVCNYEPNVMITCVDGKIRLASLKEREVLMGFDAGYVESTLPHNMPAHEKLYLGGRMVGGSPCVHVVVMLCHSLLCELGVHHVRDHEALVKKVGVAPPSWLLFPKFAKQPSSSQSSEQLVMHFCRHAERGGTDVRLDLGVPFRARAWPRAGINSSLFHWSVVHGYSWKHSAHINVLELQAVVNSLKWRLRKVGGGNCRILHLIDNQAVCGIIAKGRTSSSRLKPGLRKLNALVLASGVVMAVGYVATDSNPSDIPSRWSQRSRIHKSKRGKTIAKDRR